MKKTVRLVLLRLKNILRAATVLLLLKNCLKLQSCFICAAVKAVKGSKSLPIVSTDAVYRQTFFKEEMWRKQGAVGVDMETSALFSVGKYLNMKVVSILIASDKHPLSENGKAWKWSMSMETRFSFFEKCIDFSLQTVSSTSEERVKND